tara:strand:+ start:972 stop:1469 length:498 start_codon:yes stop_codon:yes gene_type:complete
MARTAKITNANVAPLKNAAGLVGNTPVRAQDFNDLAGDYVSLSDANAQAISSAVSVAGQTTLSAAVLFASSEDLADGAAASLTVTTSHITTGGAETATLAAGSDGQIKIFTMIADGGNMVITVSDAGWKSSGTGTLTFADDGDGCMLVYAGSKWNVIGNNGVVLG